MKNLFLVFVLLAFFGFASNAGNSELKTVKASTTLLDNTSLVNSISSIAPKDTTNGKKCDKAGKGCCKKDGNKACCNKDKSGDSKTK